MCHSRIVRADSIRGGTLPPCHRGGYAGVAFHPRGIDRGRFQSPTVYLGAVHGFLSGFANKAGEEREPARYSCRLALDLSRRELAGQTTLRWRSFASGPTLLPRPRAC